MCGQGKTSWAIEYINQHPEQSFVYVTPLLNEVDRIIQNTKAKANFCEPAFRGTGMRKLDDFNTLLCNGRNIATTHSTFSNSNAETISLIKQGNYVLFLDEVLDVIVPYNDVTNDLTQQVRAGDIKLLKDNRLIEVDELGRVSWIGESYQEYKYSDVERLAKQGNLLFINDTLFLWEFPVEIFKSFKQVFVLTYLFHGSTLCPFFQYHNIPYDMMSVARENGSYKLTSYVGDDAETDTYQQLIHFYQDKGVSNYRGGALSKNWFKRNVKNSRSTEATLLRNHLNNFFRNQCKAKSKDIMWTCGKDYYRCLKGAGYIEIRKMTREEKKMPKRARDRLGAQLSCFVPCNARATNEFRDRSVLAYCHNMYPNPYITKFFAKKNVVFDAEAFALSSLIQWVWRSRIRNGQPINLYIPSLRMCELLQDWLNKKSITAA